MKLSISILVFLCLFMSCNHSFQGEYAYNHDTTSLQWFAYKYTNVVAVEGTFDEIVVTGVKPSNEPIEVVENLGFEIKTSTVNTMLAFRDMNIVNYFFSALNSESTISGKVSGYEGDMKEGLLFIDLEMNGVVKEIPFDYQMDGTKLVLETLFSLKDFDALDALANMENCCEEVHTGEDGVYSVWPVVCIKISTDLG